MAKDNSMKYIFLLGSLLISGATYAVDLDKTCLTDTGVNINLSMNDSSITVNGAKRMIYASKSDNDPQTLKGFTNYFAGVDKGKEWNYVAVEIEEGTGKITGYIAISPQATISFNCK